MSVPRALIPADVYHLFCIVTLICKNMHIWFLIPHINQINRLTQGQLIILWFHASDGSFLWLRSSCDGLDDLGTKICLHPNVATLKVFGHLASLSKISFESSSLGHLQIRQIPWSRIPNTKPYIITAIYFRISEDIVSHTGLINI